MKYIIFALSILISQAAFAQDYPETVPDFEIFTLEDGTFTNDDVQNKNYSLFIYFNPECSHCKTTFKALELKSEEIKAADVSLYPVSANTSEKTEIFFKTLAPQLFALENMTVLRDDDYKFADKFFVGGYPTSYLYDKNKKLIKVYNGTSETLSFLEDLK
jgi:peroxiredoxin